MIQAIRNNIASWIAAGLSAVLLCPLSGCSSEPDYDLSWLDSYDVELPPELDGFNSAYRLEMTNDIDEATYFYNGNATLETRYTLASVSQAEEVSKFLQEEIFPLFPDGFIASYLPSTIYVADSVYYDYTYEVYDYSDGKTIHTEDTFTRSLYGEIGSRQLTFAASMLSETQDRERLRFEWTSLVIERMMSNTAVWTTPSDFIKISEDLLYQFFDLHFDYYKDTLTDDGSSFGFPSSPEADEFSYWYWCGSFRAARYGYFLNYVDTKEYNNALAPESPVTEDHSAFVYSQLTYKQDFADFLAYMLVYGPQGWEEYMLAVTGITYVKESSDGTVNTFVCSRDVYDSKAEIVRNYMEDKFGWTINF